MPVIHHLSCATFCPWGGRLLTGSGGVFRRARIVCHCLLIETPGALALVDTGLGTRDLMEFDQRYGRVMRLATGVWLGPENTAVRQVEAMGLNPRDVRHVVLTHMDYDHAGGLADFPWATVHVMEAERDAAEARATFVERLRYQSLQWAHGPAWQAYAGSVERGETWMDFSGVRAVAGLDQEVLLVPLLGHTRGHTGVAVRQGGRWLLHCGDAVIDHRELDVVRPGCPLMHRLLRRALAHDNRERMRNVQRLGELASREAGQVRIICSHDAAMFEAIRSGVAGLPTLP